MKNHPLWKNDKLGAGSEFYKTKAHVYESFSQAEDTLKKVAQFLEQKVRGKVVLDFGCGTGKFIPELAPLAKEYWAVDISEEQLAIAQEKANGLKNVKLIKTDEDKIPIESKSVDTVFASWVIGSIHDLDTRERVTNELKRVVKEHGSIYLVENDAGNEFKDIIEGEYGDEKTRIKHEWLEKAGFKKIETLKTYFEFENIETARDIFKTIWGDEILEKINSHKIAHNIAIYENTK
jgi:ubiquinone/menaquinone biosynthesis C-methylase UbiE